MSTASPRTADAGVYLGPLAVHDEVHAQATDSQAIHVIVEVDSATGGRGRQLR